MGVSNFVWVLVIYEEFEVFWLWDFEIIWVEDEVLLWVSECGG
jgi:hypothetical protein